jgi:hypothetical protein
MMIGVVRVSIRGSLDHLLRLEVQLAATSEFSQVDCELYKALVCCLTVKALFHNDVCRRGFVNTKDEVTAGVTNILGSQ